MVLCCCWLSESTEISCRALGVLVNELQGYQDLPSPEEVIIHLYYKDFHLPRMGFTSIHTLTWRNIDSKGSRDIWWLQEGKLIFFFHPLPFQFIFFKHCCDSGVQAPSVTCLPQPVTFDMQCTWSGAGSLLQMMFIWMGLAAGRLQKKVHEQWFLFSVFKTDLLSCFCWLFWRVLSLKLERNHYLSGIHLNLRPVVS